MNRFLRFFLYSIAMIILIQNAYQYQLYIGRQSEINFEIIPFIVFSTVFPIIIGILFAIPGLIGRINEGNNSSYDWARFLGVCIPSLFIASLPIMYIWEITFQFANFILTAGLLATSFTSIFGVVFGYVLLECLKREKV